MDRYVGGGIIKFERWNGSTYEAPVEIGEASELKLSVNPKTVKAFSKSTGVKKVVQTVVSEVETKVSLKTQEVSIVNLAMGMLGTSTTKTFEIGDTLPNGTIAAAQKTIPVIEGLQSTIAEGRLTYIGKNTADPSKNPVLVIHHVALVPSGEVRDYFSDDFGKLAFEGEPYEVEVDGKQKVFEEYFMEA